MTAYRTSTTSATQQANSLLWDLTNLEKQLDVVSRGDYRAALDDRLSRLSSSTTLELSTPEHLEQQFTEAMQLDADISGLYNLLTLREQCGTSDAQSSLKSWLEGVCSRYIQWLTHFSDQCRLAPERLTPDMQAWAKAIEAESSKEPEVIQQYRLASKKPSGAFQLRRSVIDPNRVALQNRLDSNSLTPEAVAWTNQHKQQSEDYFKSLIADQSNTPVSLSRLRTIEAEPWSALRCSLDEALDTLILAFSFINTLAQDEAVSLCEESRLWISDDPYQTNACLDTPLGSYISCHFSGGLDDLIQLGHEFGHAIHFTVHRHSPNWYQSLTEVDQETWALATENALLASSHFLQRFGSRAIDAYTRYRQIEMNHRHRLLTEFEFALHDRHIKTTADINAIWQDLNSSFYGNLVKFEPGFETAWQNIHHLTSSPFYLSVYGPAKERADKTTLASLIKNHPKKGTKRL